MMKCLRYKKVVKDIDAPYSCCEVCQLLSHCCEANNVFYHDIIDELLADENASYESNGLTFNKHIIDNIVECAIAEDKGDYYFVEDLN